MIIRSIAAISGMLLLTACGQEASEPDTPQDDSRRTAPAPQSESVAPAANGEPAGSDWRTQFSPDIPYYNISGAPVTAHAAADPDSPVVGTVAIGDGGFIKACNSDATWCEITFGGNGASGWVDMANFGGRAG
ncbi:MAG: hypothetical protein AAGA69_00945 [Pseudomonadota bacterium]